MRVLAQVAGAGIPVSPLTLAGDSRSALHLPTAMDRVPKPPCAFSFVHTKSGIRHPWESIMSLHLAVALLLEKEFFQV